MNRQEQNEQLRFWLSRHRGILIKIVRSFAKSPHDQDDLFQEITVRLWDSIPGYKNEVAETTWVYRVALYSAINWSKRERRVQQHSQPLVNSEQLLTRAEEPDDPRLDWLYEQLTRMDEVDRSLTLLMLDGLSYREMAETLGISVSNVGVKLNRIKKHLTELCSKGDIA